MCGNKYFFVYSNNWNYSLYLKQTDCVAMQHCLIEAEFQPVKWLQMTCISVSYSNLVPLNNTQCFIFLTKFSINITAVSVEEILIKFWNILAINCRFRLLVLPTSLDILIFLSKLMLCMYFWYNKYYEINKGLWPY